MSTKTMLAGACALAMSFAVSAADWFNANIGNYTEWPTTTGITGGSWDNTEDTTLAGEAGSKYLVIDTDDEAPLTFTATSPKVVGDAANDVVVDASVKFVAVTEPPTVDGSAKAGVIAYNGYYYVLGNGESGNAWQKTDIEFTADTTIAVQITAVKKDATINTVTYKLGDNKAVVYDVAADDNKFNGVAISGSGELSVLSAAYAPIEYGFTVTAPANATVDSVKCGDTVLDYPYSVEKGKTVVITYKANDGYFFAGGKTTLTKEVAISSNNQEVKPDEGSDPEKGKVQIGTKVYLTLKDAVDAAKDGDTIVMLANDTGTTALTVNANFKVDIDGFEVTIGGATINADKTLTLKNSKIGTSGWLKTTGAIAVNGTLDMSEFAMGIAYNGIHEDSANVEGGAIRIGAAGLVKFIADSGAYLRGEAICYSPNFMVANLPGTFGETATGAKIQLGDKGTWTYNGSLWAVENAVATAYLSGVTRTSAVGEAKTCDFTETYASLADAVAAADADSTIKLIADYSIDELTLAKACTFDLNGKTLTIASGSSFTANANLKVVNSVADQGGLVVAGTVYANAYVNLNDIAYGAGGLVKQQGGALTIGAEGSVKFMSAWDGETANALNAYTQGFFKNTANGAKVITGTTYTWNGSMFTIDGAIATATITRGGATFVEAFTSLADAIAAANADTTVTLVADTTLASTLTISKAITLDLGAKTVTLSDAQFGIVIDADATVKNGSVKSALTANVRKFAFYVNQGKNPLLKDLAIDASYYEYGLTCDSQDFEPLSGAYEATPTSTVTCENVDVTGNGTLIYAQWCNVTLDADCSAIRNTELPLFSNESHQTAIYSCLNATVTINGGTYTHVKALLSGNLGAKIIANDGTFNGQIYSWMQVGAHSELEAYESYKATFTLNGGTYTDATIAFQNADSRSLDVFTKGVSVELAAPTGYKWSNPQATSVETLVADNGPSVPAEEGKIEKKDDNTYVVTPAADTNVVTVSNLPDGAKVEVSAQIDLITGVPASQVVVTNTMVSGYDISAAFKVQSVDVVGGGVAAQIVLDETASVKIGEETIPVTPTVKDEVTVAGKTEPAFTPDGDNTAIAVKAIPGLTYQLIAGENVGTITTPASEATPATEAGIKLTADPTKFSSTTGKAFYKVQVTK